MSLATMSRDMMIHLLAFMHTTEVISLCGTCKSLRAQCSSLTSSLRFPGRRGAIAPTAIRPLVENLFSGCALTRVDVSGCRGIPEGWFTRLLEVHGATLTTLNVSNCAHFHKVMPGDIPRHLTHLFMASTKVTADWIRAFAGGIAEFPGVPGASLSVTRPGLRSLDVRGCHRVGDAIQVLMMRCGSRLEYLNISGIRCSTFDCLRYGVSLTSLNARMGDTMTCTAERYEVLGTLTNLRHLNLNSNVVQDECAPHLAKLVQLEELLIHQGNLGDESVIDIANSCRKLTRLGLLNNPCGAESIAAISSYCPEMRDLGIKGWNLGSGPLAVRPLNALGNLDVLNLDHTDISPQQLQCLGGFPLRILNLRRNARVTDGAMQAVCEEFGSTLAIVNISGCVLLTDAAVETFSKRLPCLAILELHSVPKLTRKVFEYLTVGCPKLFKVEIFINWSELVAGLSSIERLISSRTPSPYPGYEFRVVMSHHSATTAEEFRRMFESLQAQKYAVTKEEFGDDQ